MEKIDEVKALLERYFNAETTLQEEQQLRDYFRGEVNDEELLAYKPLFNCFSDEADKLKDEEQVNSSKQSTTFKRTFHFRWISVAAAAALALFTYLIMPDRGDSLKMMVDGVNVYNKEMALSKADGQMSNINSMMGKFKNSSAQLESMGKVGDALSPLRSMSKAMTQND
ncbi:MAG: hypothetical protein CVU13_10615 [Bacteroidetes bacterium HGW-Bacteroidetes-8]|jgi:hypothetical protein|nr:MAG: hypothetical protein CVU13_10615 [Bacteroidetes bacterium HGW-Bacteroidetes-8]